MPTVATVDGLRFAAPALADIGRKVRSGAKWSVLSLGTRQVIGLGTTAVLARLISPESFGLVAMVTVLTAFLSLLDVGLGWATVQAPEMDRRKASLLFWIGALVGAGLWGICLVAAPLVAEFYGRSELTGICGCLGGALMLNSLGTQPAALLKRQIRQEAISTIETAALAAASVTALSLAAAGLGYWALVAQIVVLPLARLALLLVSSGFWPGRPASLGEAAGLVRFGGYYGLCAWVAYFQLYLDSILVGYYCGAEALGMYSRAVYLKTLPTMYAAFALNDILVPALATLRTDPMRFGAAYRKALRIVAFVGCPLGALLGVAAPEIVRLLYGPRWDAVAPLLQWLAWPAVILPIQNTIPWLFIASGKSREFFRLNLLLTPVAVLGYWLAAGGGPLGMAITGALLYTVPLPLFSLWHAHRTTRLPLGSTLAVLFPVLVSCLAAVAAGLLAGWLGGLLGSGTTAVFWAKLAAGGAVYVGLASVLVRACPSRSEG